MIVEIVSTIVVLGIIALFSKMGKEPKFPTDLKD